MGNHIAERTRTGRHECHKNILAVIVLMFQNVWHNCHLPQLQNLTNHLTSKISHRSRSITWTKQLPCLPKPTEKQWKSLKNNESLHTVPAAQHWCQIQVSGAPAKCSTAWRPEEPQVQLMQKRSEPSRHPWCRSLSWKKLKKNIWKI